MDAHAVRHTRPRRSCLLVLFLAITACTTARSSASSPNDAAPGEGGDALDAGPLIPAPGLVTDAGACEGGVGALPSTTCARLTVSCPTTAELAVEVRTTMPSRAPIATLLLGTGGGGNGFFEDSSPVVPAFLEELVAAGYVLVQRSWDPPGWFPGTTGVRASSCRYATLLRWAAMQASSAPMCAMGESGGAIEIAYALSRWDGSRWLQGAVLVAGPSVSNLALACPTVAPSSWLATGCPELVAKYEPWCASNPVCTLTLTGAATVVDTAWAPNQPCRGNDAGSVPPDAGPLIDDDGVLGTGARVAYPGTALRFVLGHEECDAPELLFVDAVTTKHQLSFIPDAGHVQTAAGVAEMGAALKTGCVAY